MTVPDWVQDAVFYQIFPDRFANGDPGNNPPNVQPWGAEPTIHGFMGGDLKGIVQKIDHLLELGVTALYMNPIFRAASNHRYDGDDYYQIDPTLGTMDDFRRLIDTAHRNGVRVILDGVFNHTGRGFFAFSEVLSNGEHARYKDWYHIKGFPLDAYTGGKAQNYEAWWGFKGLPKLNTSNPAVRQYIMGVAKYWLEQGIDGWRLDVPEEINDDGFWHDFRQVVKSINPEAYTVGEVWKVNPKWVDDNHFDGLMHYPVRDALLNIFTNGHTPTQFADELEGLLNAYPRENLYAMYVPLSSHDVPRLMTVLEGHADKFKLAYLVLFANPGAPAVYYGDEVGLDGGKDPACRKAFPWDREQWHTDIFDHICKLVAIRKKSAALRRGEMKRVYVNDEQSGYAFVRTLGEEKVLCIMNLGEETRKLSIPVEGAGLKDGDVLADLITNGRYGIKEGIIDVTLPPWSGVLLGTL